jgi:hypothetical protein
MSTVDDAIPLAWINRAAELADWASRTLVNRPDTYGGYVRPEIREKVGKRSFTSKKPLTDEVLRQHFDARHGGHVIGLHPIVYQQQKLDGETSACWSRWGVIDIDRHTDDVSPATTEQYALALYRTARDLGLQCLLSDSDGKGGRHLWIIFDRPVPTRKVYALLQWLVRGYRAHGIQAAPETFPKQAKIAKEGKGSFGNWIRIFGRHHTRLHWSRIWDDESGTWLEGDAAIDVILATEGGPPTAIPAEALKAPEKPKGERQRSGKAPTLDDAQLAAEAVQALDSRYLDDYDLWLRVGMALRVLGSIGLTIWDTWSSGSLKHQEGACAEKWATMGTEGLTLGSLFTWAEQCGWVPPWKRTLTKQERRANATGVAYEEPDWQAIGQAEADEHERTRRVRVEIKTERHTVHKETVAALAGAPDLYCFGESLVGVTAMEGDQPLTSHTKLRGTQGAPKVRPLSDAMIGCALTQRVKFFTWRKGRDGEETAVDAHPPDWLIRSVATRGHWPGVPRITGLAECAFLRPDGSICSTPGYDPETGTYLVSTCNYLPPPEHPTQADAAAAADRLLAPLSDFPFATDNDRAVYLAALLTAVARPAIDGPTPGIAVNGNKASTGKGKLINTIGWRAFGRDIPTSTWPADAVEAEKLKVALALAGCTAVHFDNLPEGSVYGNPVMDSAVTSETTTGRILGQSRDSGELALRPLWVLSGNNIAPGRDGYRRWLPLNLRTDLERPEERRDIKIADLKSHILEHRAEAIRDCLAILRAHFLAGRPSGDWGRLGSFEVWDGIVRAAIWYAKGWDCTATRRVAADDSDERRNKIALMRGWAELPEGTGKGITVADALKAVSDPAGTNCPVFRSALANLSHDGKPVSARFLGDRIRAMKGSCIGGTWFEVAGEKHNAKLWRVAGKPEGPPSSPDSDSGHRQGGESDESGESASTRFACELRSPESEQNLKPYEKGLGGDSPDSLTPPGSIWPTGDDGIMRVRGVTASGPTHAAPAWYRDDLCCWLVGFLNATPISAEAARAAARDAGFSLGSGTGELWTELGRIGAEHILIDGVEHWALTVEPTTGPLTELASETYDTWHRAGRADRQSLDAETLSHTTPADDDREVFEL